MTPETRYARTTDGTHVAYQVHGDGLVDMVVMRGWQTNIDHEWGEPVYAGMLRRLGASARVVRLDRRGTGLSDRFDPSTPPTVESRIDDIRAALDAAGSERVVVAGFGASSSLCTFFAATYPERTAGLVLWSPPPPTLARIDAAALDADRNAIHQGWGALERTRAAVARSAPSRLDDDDFVRWFHEERLSITADEAAAQWRLLQQTNVEGILSSIHVPTLVMWRAEASNVGREFASRISTATAVELPGRDHMITSGDWRRPLAEIERFIERVADVEPESDRVLATVMFTDIVGSTERAAAIGDREWRALVDAHHAAIRRQIARFRGREVDTAGDGFFAAFDGPARAIRAATEIRDAVAGLGLELRIGLHAGECERAGTGLRGVAVHVGARVSAAAAPGEVLVSSTVRDLVAGAGIVFEDAGLHSLKGVPEEWRLYRVAAV